MRRFNSCCTMKNKKKRSSNRYVIVSCVSMALVSGGLGMHIYSHELRWIGLDAIPIES